VRGASKDSRKKEERKKEQEQRTKTYSHQQNLGELSSTWQGCAVP